MLNQEEKNKIRQQKLNALTAMQLHKNQISTLQQRNRLVESLSIAVSAFYLTPRLLAKGTSFANIVDNIGEILAAILLVLTILKLINKWQDDEIRHEIMLRRNRDIVYEADRLLERPTTNREVLEQFLRRVKDVDDEDQFLLLNIKRVEKQKAYRDALKEFGSSTSTPCPICGADPWTFTPGRCEACGGTPVQSRTN
jgi:mobilome CxxCx(11)CxxC protein